MSELSLAELQSRFGSEHLHFIPGPGALPVAELTNAFGQATVALHGAHVMSYIPAGENPVIWMSEKSLFGAGEPIRGGVPVCWPWFGPDPAGKFGGHGFARLSDWRVHDTAETPSGESAITFELDNTMVDAKFNAAPFRLELTVTLGSTLAIALKVFNTGADKLSYSGALHTYFKVGEASRISVEGLEECEYSDKVLNVEGVQHGGIVIDREIDRVYRNTSGICRIVDPDLKRVIRIAKAGSISTVVWNPWIAKSQRMSDFGDEEFHTMVCVEAANAPAAGDARELVPGGMAELRQVIGVEHR